MKKSIACCYLTHNHPAVIEDVLSVICETYPKHNIDIYICDSSDTDETKSIFEKYHTMYPEHLFYMDTRFVTTGDEKLLHIIQGNGLNKHYDYIWPTKDRCYFTGNTLDEIVNSVNEGHDVVFAVNENDRWELMVPKVKDIYTDAVEFFSHYGQLCTNWEAVIRKTESMVDTVDWTALIKDNNLGAKNPFNQPVSLFARLAQMDKLSVKVIHHDPLEKLCSHHASSEWRNTLINIWIDKWIPAIFNLPSIYDAYKLSIIKSELGLAPLFGSTESLLWLKEAGQLNQERYNQVKSIWNMITDYPEKYLDYIWNMDIEELITTVQQDFVTAFKTGDYPTAYALFMSNNWFNQLLSAQNYNDLSICFTIYKYECNDHGYSVLFKNATSANEVIARYREYINSKK